MINLWDIELDDMLVLIDCDQKIRVLVGDQETYHKEDYKSVYDGKCSKFHQLKGDHRKYQKNRVISVNATSYKYLEIRIQE